MIKFTHINYNFSTLCNISEKYFNHRFDFEPPLVHYFLLIKYFFKIKRIIRNLNITEKVDVKYIST